jgi:hypothetical protein
MSPISSSEGIDHSLSTGNSACDRQPFFTRKNLAVEISHNSVTPGASTKTKWRLRVPSLVVHETFRRGGPYMGFPHKDFPTEIEGAPGQSLKVWIFDFHKIFLWRSNCPAGKVFCMICPETRTPPGFMYRLAPIPQNWSQPKIVYTTRDLHFYVNFDVFSEGHCSVTLVPIRDLHGLIGSPGPALGFLDQNPSTEIEGAPGQASKGDPTRVSCGEAIRLVTKVLTLDAPSLGPISGWSVGLPQSPQTEPARYRLYHTRSPVLVGHFT